MDRTYETSLARELSTTHWHAFTPSGTESVYTVYSRLRLHFGESSSTEIFQLTEDFAE